MDVGLDELGGAEDRAVDMRLGREIDDCLTTGARRGDRIRVADVALDELAVAADEVRAVPGIRQLVEDDDLLACRREPLCEVGADEAGAACNQDAHSQQASRAAGERLQGPLGPASLDCWVDGFLGEAALDDLLQPSLVLELPRPFFRRPLRNLPLRHVRPRVDRRSCSYSR